MKKEFIKNAACIVMPCPCYCYMQCMIVLPPVSMHALSAGCSTKMSHVTAYTAGSCETVARIMCEDS